MDSKALALAITKAIAYTENGGKVDLSKTKAGGSGELKSVFQFLPATWKRDAKEITGDENLPVTPANEALVAHGIIQKQVDKGLAFGKNPDTIAKEVGSTWNSGKPDSYKENLKGINKEGVAYDTPAYADKVANYTKKFLSDINGGQEVGDTHATNTDTGHATAVVNKFLKGIQDSQVSNSSPKKSIPVFAANAPLPQNNAGMLSNQASNGTIPGMLS